MIDFVIKFPVSTNCKGKIYDLILVIINWLIKMIYYELVKVITNILSLVKVILDIVIWYYDLLTLL